MLHGPNFDAALAKSRELAQEFGYTMVLPFDDPDTIAGQGTIGKEVRACLCICVCMHH